MAGRFVVENNTINQNFRSRECGIINFFHFFEFEGFFRIERELFRIERGYFGFFAEINEIILVGGIHQNEIHLYYTTV